jgi:hypothetical protein
MVVNVGSVDTTNTIECVQAVSFRQPVIERSRRTVTDWPNRTIPCAKFRLRAASVRAPTVVRHHARRIPMCTHCGPEIRQMVQRACSFDGKDAPRVKAEEVHSRFAI